MPPNNRSSDNIEGLAREVSDGFAAVTQMLQERDGKLDNIERKVERDITPSLNRFMHLVDGNGVPPLAVRLAVAEEKIMRHESQFATQRNWIAGLSAGLILTVAGSIVTYVLK